MQSNIVYIMTQTYVKECSWCKSEIRMSDQKDGRWHAYSLINGNLHDCRKNGNGNGNPAGNGTGNPAGNGNTDKPKQQERLQFDHNDVITLEVVLKKLKLIGIDLDIEKLLKENED